MVSVSLDLDGVLGGFDEHVNNLFGGAPRDLVFDCPERGPLTRDAALWAHVGTCKDFWETIPVKEGAFELFETALADQIPTILTGCPRDGYDLAAEHKVQWIDRHFGQKYGIKVPVITCLSKDKPLHMKNPKDILVDDFIANIKKWQKAGGVTVWYTNPEDGLASFKRKIAHAKAR